MFNSIFKSFKKNQLTHFGVHGLGNAGDNVLFKETRNLFDYHLEKFKWDKKQVRHYCDLDTISSINKNSKGIIVGGGGLLLKDTALNNNSGWQWNCPIPSLKKINIPLIIFAIGYNRFYNQGDFSEIFNDHIIKTVHKSSFFGMRNQGSINSLKEYLPKELHPKLLLQPCPTTLLSYLYPNLIKTNQSKYLAVNLAFDRSDKRFGNNIEQKLESISKALFILQNKGWKIDYLKHSKNDELALPYLKNNNINFNYIDLDKKRPKTIIKYYNKVTVTLGMRGHSQMIPFGLQNNIVSLISHPKLLYFLKDINQSHWGININSKNIIDEIVDKVNDIGYENWSVNNQNLLKSQLKIYNKTKSNFELINQILYK